MSTYPEGVRVRDVKQAPDGALYVVSAVRPTPGGGDRIFRLVPNKKGWFAGLRPATPSPVQHAPPRVRGRTS